MSHVGVFLTYVLLAGTAATEQPKAAPRATLADVVFIAGHWVGPLPEPLSEEIWTGTAGDGMLGMWRWIQDGSTRVVELLSIRQEANGPVLRLRHFDGALIAREDKDAPIVLPLVRATPGEAVFEGKSATGGLLRLTYRRDGDDAMIATLEKDGEKPVPFRLQRVRATAR